MSYGECGSYSANRVGLFSSPSVTYQGIKAGDAKTADCAARIRSTAPFVVQYRAQKNCTGSNCPCHAGQYKCSGVCVPNEQCCPGAASTSDPGACSWSQTCDNQSKKCISKCQKNETACGTEANHAANFCIREGKTVAAAALQGKNHATVSALTKAPAAPETASSRMTALRNHDPPSLRLVMICCCRSDLPTGWAALPGPVPIWGEALRLIERAIVVKTLARRIVLIPSTAPGMIYPVNAVQEMPAIAAPQAKRNVMGNALTTTAAVMTMIAISTRTAPTLEESVNPGAGRATRCVEITAMTAKSAASATPVRAWLTTETAACNKCSRYYLGSHCDPLQQQDNGPFAPFYVQA
eukprot:gene10982-11137_t